MIDVACHEAYPGHHAQFLSEEQSAGAEGLPVEDRIVLLRSPLSVLLEGAANFGIELAFTPAERAAFERETLFPLAGLDPSQVDRFEKVQQLVDKLSSAAGPILAAYRMADCRQRRRSRGWTMKPKLAALRRCCNSPTGMVRIRSDTPPRAIA